MFFFCIRENNKTIPFCTKGINYILTAHKTLDNTQAVSSVAVSSGYKAINTPLTQNHAENKLKRTRLVNTLYPVFAG